MNQTHEPRGDQASAANVAGLAELLLRREASAHPGSQSSYQFGTEDLLATCRRWWWQCALCGVVLAALAGTAVWLTFVPIYEASAWLEIKDQPQYVAFENANNSRLFSETQLQTIRSPVCLSKVIGQPAVVNLPELKREDAPLDWLRRGLKVSYLGRSELCEIRFQAHDPQTAADVANAVMDAYLSLHTTALGTETERIVELLTAEKARRAEEVRHFQERVRLLAKHVSEDDPSLIHHEQTAILLQNPLLNLQEKRTAAEVEQAVLAARLKALEESLEKDQIKAPEAELALALEEHAEVKNLRAQQSVLRTRLRDHRRRSQSDRDPIAVRMEAELKEIDAGLQKATSELRPRLIEQMQSRLKAEHLQSIGELRANIENQQVVQKLWEDRIDAQRQKLEKLSDRSVDLDFARAELERAEQVFSKISDRIVALQTEMGAPPRANPLQRAAPPEKPREVVPYKRFAVACFGVLFLPLGVVVAWDRWIRRIHDARQLAHEVDLPVLGEITALPARWLVPNRRSDARFLRDRLTYEESIESLRVGLIASAATRDLHSLAITSAVSREGKTSLASSLAASLSKSSRKPTLVIDADMRCPNLHDYFGADLTPGLAEVLSEECRLADAIVDTENPMLQFLPAGCLKISPHVLLREDAFRSLLEELRPRFRHIVIDLPPVLAASESRVLASAAEGTLVCTMRDVSRGSQFRLACDRLNAAGARLIGAVIAGLPSRVWAYKYGGYGYGWEPSNDAQQPRTALTVDLEAIGDDEQVANES
jgi:capsular exopolysaccharide synthesis family protein